MRLLLFIALLLGFTFNISAAPTITGAGSSFIAPIMYEWASNYNKETKVKINFQSIGSGAGVKQIESKIVDFGATDMPLKNEELQKHDLIQFPLVIGGIVLVTNIPNVKPGELILDARTTAMIYSGEIKKWDDKRLADLNPHLKLPSSRITVVYRADGSGTTFNFTSYLQNASEGIWKAGSGASISWPRGIIGVGGNGNEGVTSLIKRAVGSIGYVEYSYALQNKLSWSRMKNSAGTVVPLANKNEDMATAFSRALQSAAANAQWEKSPAMDILLLNQPGKESWPLTASTFVVMYKKQKDKKTASDLLHFFDFAYTKGAVMARKLNYVPMPQKTVQFIENMWAKHIKSSQDNSTLWTQ